jgi:hypothetical protein
MEDDRDTSGCLDGEVSFQCEQSEEMGVESTYYTIHPTYKRDLSSPKLRSSMSGANAELQSRKRAPYGKVHTAQP